MSAITIADLHYSVRRHFWCRQKPILRGVDLSVERGEVYGFLGPNGAGKTTTLKALLGLLVPARGHAHIFGEPATRPHVRAKLGFMPERAYFPEHLSARELLTAHALLMGARLREARRDAEAALELVGMRGAADERLRAMSKGMQQRVGLGQALLRDPELIILDEPMSGLDPIGRHDVRALITNLKSAGRTVFFSTHILPDVEAICDRVAILVDGQVRRIESLRELMRETEHRSLEEIFVTESRQGGREE